MLDSRVVVQAQGYSKAAFFFQPSWDSCRTDQWFYHNYEAYRSGGHACSKMGLTDQFLGLLWALCVPPLSYN